MTKREEAIDAAARALNGCEGDISWDEINLSRAEACLDAILDVLGKPGEEMVEAVVSVGYFDPSDMASDAEHKEMAADVLRAMLATLRKEG